MYQDYPARHLLRYSQVHVCAGVPVAQWVKRWPTDLAVPGSSPARDEIFSTVNGVPSHTAFHYHPPIETDVSMQLKKISIGSEEEVDFVAFCYF